MGVMGGDVEFKGYEQDQGDLFPAHLSEALDPGDPVFFISDWVESLDLGVFEQRYGVMGEHPYPPRVVRSQYSSASFEELISDANGADQAASRQTYRW